MVPAVAHAEAGGWTGSATDDRRPRPSPHIRADQGQKAEGLVYLGLFCDGGKGVAEWLRVW